MKFKKYPKRYADKNYFLLPNEIFNLDLSSGEISLYSYLLRCEDRKTFRCYPSYKTIGKALKISKNTVKKYVELLYEKRFIDVAYTSMYTKDGKKFNGNLMYTIRPIQEAIDYNLDKQFERNTLIKKQTEFAEKNADLKLSRKKRWCQVCHQSHSNTDRQSRSGRCCLKGVGAVLVSGFRLTPTVEPKHWCFYRCQRNFEQK